MNAMYPLTVLVAPLSDALPVAALEGRKEREPGLAEDTRGAPRGAWIGNEHYDRGEESLYRDIASSVDMIGGTTGCYIRWIASTKGGPG